MSRKAPKNYGKASNKPAKSTVTEEDKRQVHRIMIGIAVALFVIAGALWGWNAYVNHAF
ncbi:MAG: hypothetical protein Q4D23_04705 [Bacteroidales bacterium]|nr:hypothetical protein [Bacteroidales bacterium]